MGRDLGDFQTPRALVAAVLARLTANGGSWRRALEPNCGRGNFLAGLLSLETAPREIQGVELQPEYLSEARDRLSKNSTTVRSTLIQANLFEIDLKTLRWDEPESPILVVGNPPG